MLRVVGVQPVCSAPMCAQHLCVLILVCSAPLWFHPCVLSISVCSASLCAQHVCAQHLCVLSTSVCSACLCSAPLCAQHLWSHPCVLSISVPLPPRVSCCSLSLASSLAGPGLQRLGVCSVPSLKQPHNVCFDSNL